MFRLDFLILFGSSFVFFSCEGAITSPPENKKYIFLPGQTANITWVFNDSPLSLDSRSWSFNTTNGPVSLAVIAFNQKKPGRKTTLYDVDIVAPATLVLKNVNQSYNGFYSFTLTVTGRTFTRRVRVFIATKPAVTQNCSSLVTLNEGDNFACLCKDEGGSPPANVTWYKDGLKVIDDGTERQTLRLLDVGRADRGTYKCVATSNPDEKYTDEKFTQVIIFFKPTNTVIRFSENPAAIIGSTTVTCTSDGFPEPIYTIYHNDTKVVSNKRYTITQVKWEDAGTYKCIVTNAIGKYSVNDYLNVMEKTKPTRATSRSLSSTSVRNREDNETENGNPSGSNDSETKWYIVVVILVSGIFIGILFSYIFVRSRRKFKRRKPRQSNPEPPTSQLDSTYQELDLTKMNTEDNYQSLRVNAARNDGVKDDQSTYTDLSKTRDKENNYQSLT